MFQDNTYFEETNLESIIRLYERTINYDEDYISRLRIKIQEEERNIEISNRKINDYRASIVIYKRLHDESLVNNGNNGNSYYEYDIRSTENYIRHEEENIRSIRTRIMRYENTINETLEKIQTAQVDLANTRQELAQLRQRVSRSQQTPVQNIVSQQVPNSQPELNNQPSYEDLNLLEKMKQIAIARAKEKYKEPNEFNSLRQQLDEINSADPSYKKCNICFEDYNTTINIPFVGECGHVICKVCADNIGKDATGKIKCSICRTGKKFIALISFLKLKNLMKTYEKTDIVLNKYLKYKNKYLYYKYLYNKEFN